MEDEVIDECFEFITDIIPVRLENLKEPIDYSKDVLRLGYYQPRTKYEFKVCKEDNPDDCQLRYSDNETYTVKASDRDYKKVVERYEMHGRSINRTHSYIFKYKSVKLKLDEGLIRGENGAADTCKEDYRSCGKFNTGHFGNYKILCFPWAYDCPYKSIKVSGSQDGKLADYPEQIVLEEFQTLNLRRFTENDIITSLFTGFYFHPFYQKENLDNLPFTFTTLSNTTYLIFKETIDLRELLKENNIYSHFLDIYFKNVGIDKNNTFLFTLSARFTPVRNIERKCGVKEEPKEEYLFDNYDNDCLSMIEHIRPKNASGPEKLYERDVLKLAHYIPKFEYEHYLCKKANQSDCKIEYTNDSEYQMMYYDQEYDFKNTTYIGDRAKPIYIFHRIAFQYDKLNIQLKESFDINLYKCKDGYRPCARIQHHPWATLLCVPNMNYCPMSDIIGDMYIPNDPYYVELYPYEFSYTFSGGKAIYFHYGRYKMNETIHYVTKGLYLRSGIMEEDFEKLFPFYIGERRKGVKSIDAYQDRTTILEAMFAQNGIATNFFKLYYPDELEQRDIADDRKTRMYLNAEVQYYKDLELKCEEPSTNNEIKLYGVIAEEEFSGNQTNQTSINETTTNKIETKTDIPVGGTDKVETKTEVPDQKTDKEETKTEVPDQKTDKVETKTEVPVQKTDKVDTKTEVPESKTDKVDTKTEVPESKTDKVETKTEVPVEKTEKVDTKTEVPVEKTEKVDAKTEVPDAKTDKVETKTEVPVDKTDKVETKTEVPDQKTEKVDTKTEVPVERTEKVDTKTEVPDTKTENVETGTNATETRTENVGTKTDVSEEKTDKMETKANAPEEKTENAETKTDNTNNDDDTYVDPYAGQCFVQFCQTCEATKSYFCSKCESSNYEINSASGSCVLKTTPPAISFADIYGFTMKKTKTINNRPYTGPFLKMKGLTCSQVVSKHAFIIRLLFKLKSRLRFLEDNTLIIPAICEADKPVSESSSNLNSVNYECIGEKEVSDKYVLSEIKNDEFNLDKSNLENDKQINQEKSSYKEGSTPVFTVDQQENIMSNNNNFEFTLSGKLVDKNNVLSNTKDVKIPLKDRTENVICDFTKGSDQNASLDCKLTINSSNIKKRVLSKIDMQFKDNLVKIGNTDVYMNKLNDVHLIQDPDYKPTEESKFTRINKSSSSSHKSLIIALSVVLGLIVIAAVIVTACCLKRKGKDQAVNSESTINSVGIDNLTKNNF